MSRFRLSKRQDTENNVENELNIEEKELNKEIMDQPLYFRKWTKLLSEVSMASKRIKMTLEELESELYIKFSNDGTGKKVKELEAFVALDPDIKRLKRELIEAEKLVDEFSGIVRAFHQRAEMLKDLSANLRKELI